jgi:hypothetical protein
MADNALNFYKFLLIDLLQNSALHSFCNKIFKESVFGLTITNLEFLRIYFKPPFPAF